MKQARDEHWSFFLYTFLWSWSLWLVPVIFGLETTVSKLFYALGGIAPSTVGIFMAYSKKDRKYWKDFWHRIFDFRLIGFGWYLVIFLFVPVSSLIAVMINYFLTGTIPELSTLKSFLANPIKLIPFAVFMLFFGPIVEELGWRGFALDHLEKRYSWIKSSIILGSFWALWHLPLFFVRGTYQYNLMNDSFIYFIDFMVAFFPASVVMDWIYNNNGRSILSGVLFHFCMNFFGEVIDLPNHIKPYSTIVMMTVAIAILISWKSKNENRDSRPEIW
ncbi:MULTISPECIES: type II CAAX endopeptidase family protein [Kosmotoga]|jgi:membrane protease YdiL (CAAX protease family)|uniref:Abortive infection protein n=2 Tax=Kosmotoga TaxID=651456 RepID=C5CFZ9_KOSOT|nr:MULTISPECIES: type II CAAX endopeptidase family protein [Kosmotoga]ACR80493.1 Abortive infection protein [Kosmotoga olearia TBF 19.5.1]MDI3524175.1 protease family protein [Kosmotoga sp.]MDK2954054.1 protease family protein [Kosmotoga sp.]